MVFGMKSCTEIKINKINSGTITGRVVVNVVESAEYKAVSVE